MGWATCGLYAFEGKLTRMPLTQLDPNAALVLIDLQKGIARMPMATSVSTVVHRAATLADAFRQRQLPVVLVKVTGRAPGRTDLKRPHMALSPDFSDFLPELGQQPSDMVIEKQSLGAFLGTCLDTELRRRGVTHIVLGGVATSIGVESTARSGYDLGYNISFIVDVMADSKEEAHRYAIDNIFPRLGELGTLADILELLRA